MNAVTPNPSFIVEVEQEVLGALLTGGDLRRVSAILQDHHFLEDIHRHLYGLMVTAHERYNSTSVPVVAKLVPDDLSIAFTAKLNKSAFAYLAELAAQSIYGAAGLENSARKVVEQWARVTLGKEAGLLQAAANDPASNPAELVAAAGQAFDDILSNVRRGPKRKTLGTLGAAAENAFERAEEARNRGGGVSGVTWGLTDVNRVTGGIHAGEVVIMGARPSQGKTAVALSCGIRSAKAGAGVGFISLEMGSVSLASRAITDIAYDWGVKIPYSEFGRGRVEAGDIEALRSATREMERIPLWIEEQPGLSLADIRVKSERMMEAAEKSGCPLKVMFIDYLGLVRPAPRYAGNKVAEVTEISGGLKEFAREYGVGVVALSQLSRQVEQRDNKRPQLSDLRDSGAIEQDADTIIFLYREAYYLEREKGGTADAQLARAERLIEIQNKLEFIVAKQRMGPIGTVDLFADMACSAIRNGVRA